MTVSIFFTAVLTFQVFITVDQAQPAGTQSSFTVERVDTPTKETAIRAIATAAFQTHSNIFKVQPGARNSTRSRTLFLFLGDKDAFERSGGYQYPAFSTQSLATTILPADRITTEDLRGVYATSANRSQTAAILADLHRAGITASDSTVPGLLEFFYALGPGNLGAAFAVVYVALALAIAYSCSTNRKAHAVKSLHGYGRAPILGAELLSAAATFGAGLAALVVVGVPTLAVINRLRQFWRFAATMGVALAILAAFTAVLVTLLGGAVTLRHRIPEVVEGERAPLGDGILSALAQVIVLAVVLGSVSGAMNRIEAIDRTTAQLNRWTKMAPAYALRFNTVEDPEADPRNAPALDSIIKRMDHEGKVLVTGYSGSFVSSPTNDISPDDPDGDNSMIVNPKYLDIQPVLDENHHRIHQTSDGRNDFTILVPESYQGNTTELLKKYSSYFKDFACLLGVPKGTPHCDPHGTVIRTATGQSLFTFKGTDFGPAEQQERTSLTDPVLAVVSPASGLIGPSQYLAYTSQDSVLFFDANELDRQLTSAGIRDAFQGIDNAADAVSQTVTASRIEQRMDVFGLALGALVLVLATMVSAAVYCDRRRRTSFVQVIHGYDFWARHGALLTGDLGLAVLTAAATMAIGHMQRPRDLAAAVILVVAQIAITTICVRVYETRSRADFIKRP